MSLTDLQSRAFAPALGSLATSSGVAGTNLRSVSGNVLLGMDVWGGASAANRSLIRPGQPSGGLDQMVSHILAPLD